MYSHSNPSSYLYPIGAATTSLLLFHILRQCIAVILWHKPQYDWEL